MSYRTMVNDIQIFGNNDCPKIWIDYIRSQGIEVDGDGCYDGYLTDFMSALVVLEEYVMQLNRQREKMKAELGGTIGKNKIESLLDFSNKFDLIESQDQDDKYGYSLFDELISIINETYAFIPYVFYDACKDDLISDHVYTTPKHGHCFKLKEGAKIHVRAR